MRGDATKAVPTLGGTPASRRGSYTAAALALPPGAPGKPLAWRRWAAVLRRVVSDPARGKTGSAQLAITAILVIPVWVLLAVVSVESTGAPSSPRSSIVILSILAAELALGAALMSATRAWVSHEVTPAFAAAGLCAYGVHNLAEIARSTPHAAATGRISLAFAFALLFTSVVSQEEDLNQRRRRVRWAGLLALLLFGILLAPAQGPLVAATWAVAGFTAIWLGRHEGAAPKIWIGFAMLCLAQGRVATAAVPEVGLASLGGHLLRAIAMAMTLLGTVRALQESIGDHEALVLQSLTALRGSEARRRSEEQAHQEAVHNLRSAVAAIGVAADLLVFSGGRAALSNDERIQLARGLEAELERARILIAREWEVATQTFSLLELLMPVVVRQRRSGAQIELEVSADVLVKGDRNRAHEVIDILLDNALRHATGTPLTIGAVVDDGQVTLMVADRGPGLASEALEHAFEHGWTTSTAGEGAGLGLALARRLMAEQGGDLTATNRPDGGAAFLARFPAARIALVDLEHTARIVGPEAEENVVRFSS